jgi:glycosyltransferase involved in cell wall biosynthesis
MREPPIISVVTPVHNRPRHIARAVQSCLNQEGITTLRRFEVIVVDDGSTDDTPASLASFGTSIAVVRHKTNRGVCPARNSGVTAARGDWILFLDSDDELLAGSMTKLLDYAASAPPSIHRLAFMYSRDGGMTSPNPLPSEDIVGYEGYIRWMENVIVSDFNNLIRRDTFKRVRLPDDRAYETIYHLDFARLYTTRFVREVVARVHSDAPNRRQNLPLMELARQIRRDAPDGLGSLERIMAEHGPSLARWAPNRYATLLRMRAFHTFLSGKRLPGLLRVVEAAHADFTSADVWFAAVLGLAGPGSLATAMAWRMKQ